MIGKRDKARTGRPGPADKKYRIENGRVVTGFGEELQDICQAINVREVLVNAETNSVSLILTFDFKGTEIRLSIPRSKLTRRDICTTLLEFGADVWDEVVSPVLAYLREAEAGAPKILVFSDVGWGEFGGARVYKHHCLLGVNQESRYDGRLAIHPKGTVDGWKGIIEQEVLGNTLLELLLAIGFTAPVVGLVQDFANVDTLLVHLHGLSSAGKTTAARVAVSAFGRPDTKDGGLLGTWNGSKKALAGSLRGNHGVPVALDEASMVERGEDLTGFTYQIAQGIDRQRLDVTGTALPTGTWCTTVISTAEHSLASMTNQNPGVKARLIELGNRVWTRSAQNSDDLTAGLLSQYGTAGPVFVSHLMNLPHGEIQSRLRGWQGRLLARMPQRGQTTERVVAKLALAVMTAELVNEALDLTLDVEGIANLLVVNELEVAPSRDLGETAYEWFMEDVCCNAHHFLSSDNKQESLPNQTWGKIEASPVGDSVLIYPSKFEERMFEGGFTNPELILDLWRKASLLKCDSGRLTTKRTIVPKSRASTRVYCVRIRDGARQSVDTARLRRTQEPGGSGEKMEDLFEEAD